MTPTSQSYRGTWRRLEAHDVRSRTRRVVLVLVERLLVGIHAATSRATEWRHRPRTLRSSGTLGRVGSAADRKPELATKDALFEGCGTNGEDIAYGAGARFRTPACRRSRRRSAWVSPPHVPSRDAS